MADPPHFFFNFSSSHLERISVLFLQIQVRFELVSFHNALVELAKFFAVDSFKVWFRLCIYIERIDEVRGGGVGERVLLEI